MMALPTGVKVIPHCGLICVSLIISIVKHLVMCLLATHIFSFENICLGLLLTFDRVVCCCFVIFLILCYLSCFYILDINPSSVIAFANIFFRSIGCFVDGCQKLINLIRPHLSLFLFLFLLP